MHQRLLCQTTLSQQLTRHPVCRTMTSRALLLAMTQQLLRCRPRCLCHSRLLHRAHCRPLLRPIDNAINRWCLWLFLLLPLLTMPTRCDLAASLVFTHQNMFWIFRQSLGRLSHPFPRRKVLSKILIGMLLCLKSSTLLPPTTHGL
jgi:hypothetical protein